MLLRAPSLLSFGTAQRRDPFIGVFLPAILGKALFRPHLSYPLESLDISGQWLVSGADASPNEGLIQE